MSGEGSGGGGRGGTREGEGAAHFFVLVLGCVLCLVWFTSERAVGYELGNLERLVVWVDGFSVLGVKD